MYTILARVLFFNIILVFLATAVPQGVYINYFKTVYDGEINKYNMQRVRQIQSSIDGFVLERVSNLINNYFSPVQSNADLTLGLERDISRDPIGIINLTRRLADIKLTQNFIDSIYIYYHKGGMIVSDKNSFFFK